jgi:AraC family transcriptional regulator of adaptative response/methylated-DNA-[protein]-cysteine methyltransferase
MPALFYLFHPSPLGQMIVAYRESRICFLAFGSSKRRLLKDLEKSFPDSQWIAEKSSSKSAKLLVRKLNAYFKAMHQKPSIEIEIEGTPFQQKVWSELRKIPLAQTRSYKEIAHQIRRPKAARAVARACATNRIAVLIPCHRVLASNGSLSGYRWGRGLKKDLLRLEQKALA